MIQQARSSQSKSFLRELELSLILIDDKKVREYFLEKISEINNKRKDTNINHTGEKDIKSEILAYLNQKGYTQTANVWARALSIDKNDINELLRKLQTRLLKAGVNGILEIHLQDREINSPHIQFVGIQADKAEVVIAETLVELRYETSVESALSKKNFQPYYKINNKARQPKKNDSNKQIQYYENAQKVKTSNEEIQKIIQKFDERVSIFKTKIQAIKTRVDSQNLFEMRLLAIKNSNNKSLSILREQRAERRLRRMRRAKRL